MIFFNAKAENHPLNAETNGNVHRSETVPKKRWIVSNSVIVTVKL